jgi:hypothetical protein
MEKIRWAPKIVRTRIWQLYQNDALGTIDDALLEDVGFSLWLRCKAILMVSRSQLECPRCRAVFDLIDPAESENIACPTNGCGWQTTRQEYRASWRHRDLIGSNALPAFQVYVDDYPRARAPQARMVCIDQLIHAFHWDLKQDLPNRSVANNLIEGSHESVLELLDKLHDGEPTENKRRWRETVQMMMQRRRGVKP